MKTASTRIRKLLPGVDTTSLQKVLEGAPRYSRNVSGDFQAPNAAEEVFTALPENFDPLKKFVLGIEQGGSLIGCIDLLRGFPNSDTVIIGLLLLQETYQGKGLGREAFSQVETTLRGWPEIRKARISVVESNGEVASVTLVNELKDAFFHRRQCSHNFCLIRY